MSVRALLLVAVAVIVQLSIAAGNNDEDERVIVEDIVDRPSRGAARAFLFDHDEPVPSDSPTDSEPQQRADRPADKPSRRSRKNADADRDAPSAPTTSVLERLTALKSAVADLDDRFDKAFDTVTTSANHGLPLLQPDQSWLGDTESEQLRTAVSAQLVEARVLRGDVQRALLSATEANAPALREALQHLTASLAPGGALWTLDAQLDEQALRHRALLVTAAPLLDAAERLLEPDSSERKALDRLRKYVALCVRRRKPTNRESLTELLELHALLRGDGHSALAQNASPKYPDLQAQLLSRGRPFEAYLLYIPWKVFAVTLGGGVLVASVAPWSLAAVLFLGSLTASMWRKAPRGGRALGTRSPPLWHRALRFFRIGALRSAVGVCACVLMVVLPHGRRLFQVLGLKTEFEIARLTLTSGLVTTVQLVVLVVVFHAVIAGVTHTTVGRKGRR